MPSIFARWLSIFPDTFQRAFIFWAREWKMKIPMLANLMCLWCGRNSARARERATYFAEINFFNSINLNCRRRRRCRVCMHYLVNCHYWHVFGTKNIHIKLKFLFLFSIKSFSKLFALLHANGPFFWTWNRFNCCESVSLIPSHPPESSAFAIQNTNPCEYV